MFNKKGTEAKCSFSSMTNNVYATKQPLNLHRNPLKFVLQTNYSNSVKIRPATIQLTGWLLQFGYQNSPVWNCLLSSRIMAVKYMNICLSKSYRESRFFYEFEGWLRFCCLQISDIREAIMCTQALIWWSSLLFLTSLSVHARQPQRRTSANPMDQ